MRNNTTQNVELEIFEFDGPAGFLTDAARFTYCSVCKHETVAVPLAASRIGE